MAGNPRTVLVANPGSDLYGSDRMVVESVKALVRDGYEVFVTVPEPGPLVPLLTDAGATVLEQPTPIIRKSLLSPRGLVQLVVESVRAAGPSMRMTRRTNAGTVIVNTITPPLWFPLAKLMRRKVVCHVHEAEGTASPLLRKALYLPLVFTDRVVINSKFSLDVLARSAGWLAGRARIVYNAVAGPPSVDPPAADIEQRPVRLLFVGRLSHRKGPHVAIDAIRLLRERGVPATLSLLGAVFPGNESYEQGLREQVGESDLGDLVEFLGFRPDIWPQMAAHDIIVIPSTVDEPFGNTAVEASLAARPLIVSDIAGLKEASSAATSLIAVPASDPEAIADAVEAIVNDWPTYAANALTDSTVVADRFSFTQYADGFVAAIE